KTDLQFRKLISDIVLDNLIEKEYSNILTIFDREFIILKLRSHFISNTIKVEGKPDIDLNNHLELFESNFRNTLRQKFIDQISHSQKFENIEIVCGIPTLKRDLDILNYR